MKRDEILAWLLEENPDRLETLWSLADGVRRSHAGDSVHIRGLIEFSNYCRSNCHYCGMRSGRRSLARYRMTQDEILDSAREAMARGYGTVVMQSGEDPYLDVDGLAGVIERIKKETPLAVTLSLGERAPQELARLREAGADRYYLRFETSDRRLWKRIHPSGMKAFSHRLDLLPLIKKLGYETGSGIMVGIPGQTNYCAAKAAIIGFTRALAKEMAPWGVPVNAVAPGFIDTDMTAGFPEAQRKASLERVPMRRFGKADEVADLVEYLALRAPAFLTGQVLVIDGGMTG